ncbi:MAG: hypothetical protein HQK60_04250 [Deltaproteobacteria bacterium]|nr:hypothetical protein [Deltaproteobacteria bacterium]
MRRAVALILFLLFVPGDSIVYAGPPILTSDTGTPDVGTWEINLGFIVEKRQTETRYQTPDLDMNYGLTDSIQLNLEVPWVVLHETDGDTKNGLGKSDAGANC